MPHETSSPFATLRFALCTIHPSLTPHFPTTLFPTHPLSDPTPALPPQDLNRFMARENLPSNLQFRLREYFHKSKHLRLAQAQQRL